MLILQITFTFGLIAFLHTGSAKRHHHRYHVNETYLTVDAFGNCHSQEQGFYGRCLRFQDCPSALKLYEEQQRQPITCYYTTYENFICCANIKSQPLDDSSNYVNELPMSEQACADYYLTEKHHRGRSKRNHLSEVEEPIKKLERFRTQVVEGIKTEQDEFPYMCALGWKSQQKKITYHCGCVLIAPKYILTAAHCASLGGKPPTLARLGGGDLDERHVEMLKIKQIIQHPQYENNLAYHDIAIIKLKRSSRETPACLWNIETTPQEKLIALGYGQTKFEGSSSNKLFKVELNVLSNLECSKHYKAEGNLADGIVPGQICAVDPQGKMDTCQGDSGGPLLMRLPKYNVAAVPYVVGITSFGIACANDTTSGYTRISHYLQWIESIVWPNK